MIYLIWLCAFITFFCIIFLIMRVSLSEKILIKQRLNHYTVVTDKPQARVEGSFYDRVILPVLEKAASFVRRVAPGNYLKELDKTLREAGNPLNLNASKLMIMQMGAIIFEMIIILSLWMAFHAPAMKVLTYLTLLIIGTYLLPRLLIKQKIQQRHKEIQTSLPDIIDILTVSIEAGLSFDGAMAKLVEKMSGVLTSEFAIVLKEMKVGISKREAFKSLIERMPVSDLITFIGAVMQADQLGVSIGNVLRIQSGLMRQKRRQRASEQAMKAPIKMLFPMAFFILPTIFIVILGPVVINLIRMFKN